MLQNGDTFMVENARLVYRNFSGAEDRFGQVGVRTFLVVLDNKDAEEMANVGWFVKYFKPREEGDEPTPFIQVKVKFDIRPPRIIMITSAGRTTLTEETVSVLDWADIQTCDLIGRAYEWSVNGKTGINAYLQSMFVTIREDELERKYAAPEIDE
jgi:hypothetical protein